jgi:hypothetical protein
MDLNDLCALFKLKPGAMRNLTKRPRFPPRVATSSKTHR